ncbi:MAG: DUF6588 family protein [bacterium]
MRNRWIRPAVGAVGALFLVVPPARADIIEDNLSQLSPDFAKGYLDPIQEGLNASVNSGIFRTGDVPLAGLNFTLDLTASVIDFGDAEKTWTPAVPAGFTAGPVPTIIGGTDAVSLNGPGGSQIAFPGGLELSHWGFVAPQLTVGSVLGTRAMVRWLSVTLGDESLGDVNFWGVGLQHSISQYFPALPLQLAAGGMYQKVELGSKLVDANGLALNVTGSRRFGAGVSVEPYVGGGIDQFEMDMKYDVKDQNGVITSEETVSYERKTTGRFTLGANVKLAILKAFGELNFAAQNGYSFGVSFGS